MPPTRCKSAPSRSAYSVPSIGRRKQQLLTGQVRLENEYSSQPRSPGWAARTFPHWGNEVSHHDYPSGVRTRPQTKQRQKRIREESTTPRACPFRSCTSRAATGQSKIWNPFLHTVFALFILSPLASFLPHSLSPLHTTLLPLASSPLPHLPLTFSRAFSLFRPGLRSRPLGSLT